MHFMSMETTLWIAENLPQVTQLLRTLCAIPAPSGKEEQRAAFCEKWLTDAGVPGVFTDEALNVICPIHDGGGPVTIVMAHTDTVFPDLSPMPFTEDDTRLCSPGVGDDTANLALLMTAARYLVEEKVPLNSGLVLVCNSCEEGLGNLKGCRAVMERYQGRIRSFVSFDGNLDHICVRAVGSHRYRVEVETQGGHSFSAFGVPNAIHQLSRFITDFYSLPLPHRGRTTCNVGVIEGGTSVNSIAQRASMLCEYRSDDASSLATMEGAFEALIARHRDAGVQLTVTRMGERPCGSSTPSAAQQKLIDWAEKSMAAVTGKTPSLDSGSTDANIPLSLDIPAVTLGLIRGDLAHTRQEYILKDSLAEGLTLAVSILSDLCYGSLALP